MFIDDLFSSSAPEDSRESYGAETFLFPGHVRKHDLQLINLIEDISKQSPFRHMVTPSGFQMSVAMTNCGDLGWISGKHGFYHYAKNDPATEKPWPKMPSLIYEIAVSAAEKAGFTGFNPDSCIVNRYKPGAKLGLHQDSDEVDFSKPVVSISLGLPGIFLLGGCNRNDPIEKLMLNHGDVVVWGGVDRMRFHGIEPIKEGCHPLAGSFRYNLSIRQAGA